MKMVRSEKTKETERMAELIAKIYFNLLFRVGSKTASYFADRMVSYF